MGHTENSNILRTIFPDMEPVYIMVQCYSFTDRFWSLDHAKKESELKELIDFISEQKKSLIHVQAYKSLRNDMDLVFWYSSRKIDPLVNFKYKFRSMMGDLVTGSYGSFSVYRESPYLKPGQDLADTLRRDPMPYFVAYPMSKENSWYQLKYEERKEIMAEHIGVALSHPDNKNIRSYTTYSFGISDGEFMVIYEVDDFSKWSNVTAKLREVRARVWIKNEIPIITGTHIDDVGTLLSAFK